MRRILILRGGALGDFLVTLPALGLLRRRWPDAHIALAGNARAAVLGRIGGFLDSVHSQDEARWTALLNPPPLPEALASWLAEFDLVVSCWPDPDDAIARHFPLREGQQYLAGSARPVVAPAARHFCEILSSLAIGTGDFQSRLPAGSFPISLLPPGCVALHPGSGSARKNWPLSNWLAIIRRLAPEQPLLLVLGEAEMATWSEIAGEPLKPGIGEIQVAGFPLRAAVSTPLPELAGALARCRLFLGHDSGVSHLAAALGAPCILLFGPTDPSMWGPPGPGVEIISRGASLDSIPSAEVLGAIARNLRNGGDGGRYRTRTCDP